MVVVFNANDRNSLHKKDIILYSLLKYKKF